MGVRIGLLVAGLVAVLAVAAYAAIRATVPDPHRRHSQATQHHSNGKDGNGPGTCGGHTAVQPAQSVPTAAFDRLSGQTMLHCRLLMTLETAPHDPAVALALRDELSLTPEQVRDLQAVQAQARLQTQDLLTPEQAATLASLSADPQAPLKLHREIMGLMMTLHAAVGRPGEGCTHEPTPDHGGCAMTQGHAAACAAPASLHAAVHTEGP